MNSVLPMDRALSMKREVLSRVQEAFDIRERTAFYLVLGVIEIAAIMVVVSARFGRVEELALLILVILALLVGVRWPMVPLFAFAFIIPMEEVLRIGDVATLSKALGLLFALTYGLPRLGHIRFSAMPKAAYAYVAWAVLSIGWAISPGTYLGEIPTLVQLFAISVLVADVVVHRPGIVRPLLWAYSTGAAITALIGIEAYVTGNVASGQRVTAFADQDAGQFALLLLPALIFAIHELTSGHYIIPSAVVSSLTGMAIVMSGTRGAWLGIALVMIVFLLPRLGLIRGVLTAVLLALVVGAALQLPGIADLVLQRTELAVPTGGAGRADIWTVGLQIFGSAPVTGVGYANFPIAYTPARVAAADITGYTDPAFGSHSIIVGTFGELGLVGAVCLALFIGRLIVRRGWGPDAAAIQAMLAAMMVAALFIDVLNRKQVWLVLGIAAGLAYLRDREPKPVPSAVVQVATAEQEVVPSGPQWPDSPLVNRLPLRPIRLRNPGERPR